jgi:hypothetical protein
VRARSASRSIAARYEEKFRLVDAGLGHPPRVGAAQDVVGDAEDVEARAAVEVDELAERELPVAPGGVRVELAEECLRSVSLAHALSVLRRAGRVGNGVVNVVGKDSSPP